jgi:hypothetical protein
LLQREVRHAFTVGFLETSELLARVAVLSSLLLVVQSAAASAQPWTAVGSTGVVVSGSATYDCFDQAIGFFRRPVLPIDCLVPPVRKPLVADPDIGILPPLPKGSARVLYNVVFEPEMSGATPALTVRYLISDTTHQNITVRLIQQPRISFSTSVDTLLTLDSSNFPASSATQTQTVGTCSGQPLNFDENAYFIAADISNSNSTGGVVGLYQLVVDGANCIF